MTLPGDDAVTRERIRAFLAEHSTMTLATIGPGGEPAAAAVFYAADDALNLIFLSEKETQHGHNLLENPRVAGTIQAGNQDWREIRGLQFRGAAFLTTGHDLSHAVAVYGRRFAFVGALLAGQPGATVLAGPLARAHFWILRPRWFRLIDNRVRFGHKEELLLAKP